MFPSAIEVLGEASTDARRAEDVDARCCRTPFDFVLIDDLMLAASDLSGVADVSGRPTTDALGLSLPAGIFDLMAERIDRVDSFVSERLNEGGEAKPGSLELPASLPFLSFELEFPIV